MSLVARKSRLAALPLLVVLAVPAAAPAAAEPLGETRALDWQDDLRFLLHRLPSTHPDPFTKLARREFEARLDELIEGAPERSQRQMVVELASLMAALGDGHTRLTLPLAEGAGFFLGHSKTAPPNIPGLAFAPLPVRFELLDDGLVVRAAAREQAAAVGARVSRIGDKTVEEAIALVSPVVHHDNEHQLAYQLPDFLALPDVLAAVGVVETADEVRLTLVPTAGEPFELRLRPVAESRPVDWVGIVDAMAEPPLYLRSTDRKFWFEHLEADRTVYFQYNEVGDEEEETLAAFAERLFSFIDEQPVDRLVIDLRRNRGGSNGLNKAILHGLIRSPKLRQAGSLFVITGGGTFSAAMMFSIDLAKHTPAIFVGTPTGSSPNHFGDSRKIRLPRTGLTVRVSTLNWQYSDPRDDRQAIAPHLPVARGVGDLLAGRDAALETILRPGSAIASDAGHAGSWHGRLTAFRWTFDLEVVLERGPAGWSGTLDAPDLGAAGLVLEEVAVGDGRVRFVVPYPPDRRFVFEGRTEGRRLYGFMENDSRRAPFVLALDPGPAAATARSPAP